MKVTHVIIATVLLVIATLVGAYLVVALPVEADYNRQFRAHAVMAKDQATFEGMEVQVLALWSNMNQSFAGRDLNTTYSTWWPPDQTYDNSLGAQRDYFAQLVRSLENYQAQHAALLKNSSSPVVLEDWYYKAIQNVRNEMGREGGLAWALKDAWYYNLHPWVYWMWVWLPLLVVIEIAGGVVLITKSS